MAWLSPLHRSWLRQATRLLAAVFLSDLLARLCGFGEAAWALITACIVTSASVSGTLAAGRDQIVGTLIGALAGTVAIGLTLRGLPRMPVFAALLVPLALLAAARPTLRLTCVTLVVVFLFPSQGNPFERPFDRVMAILTGAFSSLVVSYLVFRPRARAGAFAAAAEMLSILAQLLGEVMADRGQAPGEGAARDRLLEAANAALRTLADAVAEARREHLTALEKVDPVLVRLLPMLRRLQSDVLFVSRAVDELPDPQAGPSSHETTLQPARAALEGVFEALQAACEAVAQRRDPQQTSHDAPRTAARLAALDGTLGRLGDIAGVPLRFTLQTLRRDLADMAMALSEAEAVA